MSAVWMCHKSNSCKRLSMSLFGTRMISRAANSIVSGGNSNSSKPLCMSSLPASMKRIRSKTAEKMWWRSFPHYKSMGIFSDAQGQLTPLSVVGSSRISNSCKLLCMSQLPARIKRIRSKTAEKTWWRPFPHYNPMGAIRCHGNQSSDLICTKTFGSGELKTGKAINMKFSTLLNHPMRNIHVKIIDKYFVYCTAFVRIEKTLNFKSCKIPAKCVTCYLNF